MTRRPRLLMLLHGYFPDDPRAAAQARAAVEAGFDVHVIALRRPSENRREAVERVELWRLPVEHLHGGGMLAAFREYFGFTLRSAVLAARLAKRHQYDVVEVHNPPDFLVLAALIPRALGARIVFDVHDLASDMFGMRFERIPGASLAARVLRLIERAAARTATAVLTVHEPYRQELAARGVPAEKITVVMNSLDERLVPEPKERDAVDAFRVVYHGTVTPHYGVGLLVEALALARDRVPTMGVEIYGEGDAIARIRSRAATLGVEKAVVIREGFLARESVLAEIQGASVGVIPNLPTSLNRFALSTKLFEYVALGIAVASSDLPTIRAHFSDEEIVFFEPGNARSLADALVEIARNPESSARRCQAARVRYEAYRWQASADAYVSVLRRLAGSTADGA